MNTNEMILNQENTAMASSDISETSASPAPSMKWYRVLMAFIWVSAIFYIGYFGPKLVVIMNGWDEFDWFRTRSTFLLIFSLALMVLAYIVWRELRKKSVLAPKLLLIWHILAIVCWVIQLGILLYHAGFDDAVKETVKTIRGDKETHYFYVRWDEIQALVAIACNALLLVVNHLYFKKRSEVFTNGDGSIVSLFRWQKKSAPSEVAADSGETATGKKLSVRRHRVTRIIAWITAVFGALLMACWMYMLYAWNMNMQEELSHRGSDSDFSDMVSEGLIVRALWVAVLVLIDVCTILYAYAVWEGLLEHRAGTPHRIVPLHIFNASLCFQAFLSAECENQANHYYILNGTEKLDFTLELHGDAATFMWMFILIYAAVAIPSYFYFKKRAHQFNN